MRWILVLALLHAYTLSYVPHPRENIAIGFASFQHRRVAHAFPTAAAPESACGGGGCGEVVIGEIASEWGEGGKEVQQGRHQPCRLPQTSQSEWR
jgi:hypothetical protein